MFNPLSCKTDKQINSLSINSLSINRERYPKAIGKLKFHHPPMILKRKEFLLNPRPTCKPTDIIITDTKRKCTDLDEDKLLYQRKSPYDDTDSCFVSRDDGMGHHIQTCPKTEYAKGQNIQLCRTVSTVIPTNGRLAKMRPKNLDGSS